MRILRIAKQDHIARFWRDRRGTALVEFGMSLPLVLVIFATIVESSRTLFAYQTAIAGVRDASRYLARVAPLDICNGGSLAAFSTEVTNIVKFSVDGGSVFPGRVTIDSVVPVCGSSGLFPSAQVDATLIIELPFKSIFNLVGTTIPDITTTITDTSRIFGV